MKLEVAGHKVELRDLSLLEWLDLDLETGIEAGQEITSVQLICRKVEFAVRAWDDKPGISAIELQVDEKLHNVAIALSQQIDKHLKETPKLSASLITAEGDNKKIAEISDDETEFIATFNIPTILDLMDLVDRYKARSKSFQKAAVIADLLVDWNGLGRVRAEALLEKRDWHGLILGCDQALEAFFRPPEVTVIEEGSTIDGDGDGGGGNDSADPGLVKSPAILIS